MKKMVLVVFSIVLSACSPMRNTMNDVMTSWKGAHIDEAIEQWGYPDESREIAGRKLYVWKTSSTKQLYEKEVTKGRVDAYGNYAEETKTIGGGTWYGDCHRILEVDAEGTITKWEWKGNDCAFYKGGRFKDWERNQ